MKSYTTSASLAYCADCGRPIPQVPEPGSGWLPNLLAIVKDLHQSCDTAPNSDPEVREISAAVRTSLDEVRTVLDALVVAYCRPQGDMEQLAAALAHMIDAIDEKRNELAQLAQRARLAAAMAATGDENQ
jgi:hypothetical protein